MAQYCFDLVRNSAADWYLPARNEWGAMWTNLVDVDGDSNPSTPLAEYEYGLVPGRYFTSTENHANVVTSIDFDPVGFPGNNKNVNRSSRCVRKGPAPRCANPYGVEGQMVYNSSYDVVQFCDGARWIAIGKSGP